MDDDHNSIKQSVKSIVEGVNTKSVPSELISFIESIPEQKSYMQIFLDAFYQYDTRSYSVYKKIINKMLLMKMFEEMVPLYNRIFEYFIDQLLKGKITSDQQHNFLFKESLSLSKRQDCFYDNLRDFLNHIAVLPEKEIALFKTVPTSKDFLNNFIFLIILCYCNNFKFESFRAVEILSNIINKAFIHPSKRFLHKYLIILGLFFLEKNFFHSYFNVLNMLNLLERRAYLRFGSYEEHEKIAKFEIYKNEGLKYNNLLFKVGMLESEKILKQITKDTSNDSINYLDGENDYEKSIFSKLLDATKQESFIKMYVDFKMWDFYIENCSKCINFDNDMRILTFLLKQNFNYELTNGKLTLGAFDHVSLSKKVYSIVMKYTKVEKRVMSEKTNYIPEKRPEVVHKPIQQKTKKQKRFKDNFGERKAKFVIYSKILEKHSTLPSIYQEERENNYKFMCDSVEKQLELYRQLFLKYSSVVEGIEEELETLFDDFCEEYEEEAKEYCKAENNNYNENYFKGASSVATINYTFIDTKSENYKKNLDLNEENSVYNSTFAAEGSFRNSSIYYKNETSAPIQREISTFTPTVPNANKERPGFNKNAGGERQKTIRSADEYVPPTDNISIPKFVSDSGNNKQYTDLYIPGINGEIATKFTFNREDSQKSDLYKPSNLEKPGDLYSFSFDSEYRFKPITETTKNDFVKKTNTTNKASNIYSTNNAEKYLPPDTLEFDFSKTSFANSFNGKDSALQHNRMQEGIYKNQTEKSSSVGGNGLYRFSEVDNKFASFKTIDKQTKPSESFKKGGFYGNKSHNGANNRGDGYSKTVLYKKKKENDTK